MESINKLIQDPGWWVTAVFVGLIVSVIAGFLKDAISQALASSSSTIRAWQQRRHAKFIQEAEELARDFGFILYTRLKAIGMLVLWSTLVIIMMAAYILLSLSDTYKSKAMMMLISSGILSFLPYFRAIHFLSISFEAKKIYTKKKFPDDSTKA